MARSNSSPNVFSPVLNRPDFALVEEIVGAFRGLFDFSVPDGYEDETGFHFAMSHTTSRPPMDSQNWLGEHI